MAKKVYLNNALASSMLPDGVGLYPPCTISAKEVMGELKDGFIHGGNPAHANTWHAAARLIGIPEVGEPKGGRLVLGDEDALIVVEVMGLPRETREFSDEEIARATFKFRFFLAFVER